MAKRINSLDGLRCLAALGVLWIHAWKLHGNPKFYIGRLDITTLLAIGGNGVDLFFVISGFCMYYFYTSDRGFSYRNFYLFILKRWVRLSPAFYVSTIIYIIILKNIFSYPINSLLDFLHSAFYLNRLFSAYEVSSHFWTLSVEWQFYAIIPFLLIYQNKNGFKKVFLSIFGSLFLAAVMWALIVNDNFGIGDSTILFHSVEFGCGILAAKILILDNNFLKNRKIWLFFFIILTYAGRVCLSKQVLDFSIAYYNLFKLAGYLLMGVGFSGILYLAVTSVKYLNLVLSNNIFKSIGKISYSFYLLHSLVCSLIGTIILKCTYFSGITAPLITTFLSILILYPLSLISYKFLEKPFL